MKRAHLILLAILSILIFHVTSDAQNDDEVISVDSSIVVMNATITDASGKAVEGLNRKLFKVFEDGVEQEIVMFASEETPFAAVILLDTSGSMEQRVTLARSAAIQFLSGLRRDDNAAIYNFDSKVKLVQDFSNSRDLREQFFDLKADGMTALNDAIYKAAEVLSKREEKRRAIIVLSDGADTFSSKSADKALQAASAVNATIYTVDMSPINDNSRGRIQNQGVLKNFAEKTGGKFVATPGGVAMRDAFKRIVEELGVQYTVAFHPANTKKDGKWRNLELRVARPNLMIRARNGYKAPKN
ncbi:MAG TPA: VWA domain-containing protein [Pyrinomonadaceae bacterium]|nr:VWA domain-containing protein [Acidobacteriota bacterium]HQZ95163.1 VWA domain-containing protein [Pyrinomonadaceae bacterium]